MNRLFSVGISLFTKTLSIFLSLSLMMPTGVVQAQSIPLPPIGSVLNPTAQFHPINVKGLTIHPENPLQFDFIIDMGDGGKGIGVGEEQSNHQSPTADPLKNESMKIIKYFLTTLTVPDNEMWVNLSPAEKDRIIADGLGQTVMGKDLLAQDYLLKQLTASLMNPETESGKTFWDKVYEKIYEQGSGISSQESGNPDSLSLRPEALSSFNKVWIIPSKASIYQHGKSVFIVENHLKVMLESDYLAQQNSQLSSSNASIEDPASFEVKSFKDTGSWTKTFQDDSIKNIIRSTIIPIIEKEVNEGETFANLRQVYNAMLLATWYKRNLKKSLLSQVYVDKNKVSGVRYQELGNKNELNSDSRSLNPIEDIYNQYVASFKAGAANLIKEDYDPETQQTVTRQYFTGGMEDYGSLAIAPIKTVNLAQLVTAQDLVARVSIDPDADGAMMADLKGGYPHADGYSKSIKGQAIKQKGKTQTGKTQTGKITFEMLYSGTRTHAVLNINGVINHPKVSGYHIKDKSLVRNKSQNIIYTISPVFYNHLEKVNFPLEFEIYENQNDKIPTKISFIEDTKYSVNRVVPTAANVIFSADQWQKNFLESMKSSLVWKQASFFDAFSLLIKKNIAPVAGVIDEENNINSTTVQDILEHLTKRLWPAGPKAVGEAFKVRPDTLIEVMSKMIISKYSQAIGLIVDVWNDLTAFPLWYAGTPGQKKKYFEPLLEGKFFCVFALTERDVAGSNAIRGMQSKAVPDGDGGYVINAEKQFITVANSDKAKYAIVFVDVDPSDPEAPKDPAARAGAFIVQLRDEQGNFLPGIEIRHMEVMGHHGSGTATVSIQNVKVSKDDVLGENWLTAREKKLDLKSVKTGANIIGKTLEAGRISISSIALGSQWATLEELTKTYEVRYPQLSAREREEWEQAIADLKADFLAGWSLIQEVARMKDRKENYNLQAGVLKMTTTEAAVRNTMRAMRLVGKESIQPNHPLWRIFRDNKLLTIGEGTTQIMRELIVNELRRRYHQDKKVPVIELLKRAAVDSELIDADAQGVIDFVSNSKSYTEQQDPKIQEVMQWQMIDRIAIGVTLKIFEKARTELNKDSVANYSKRAKAMHAGFLRDRDLLTGLLASGEASDSDMEDHFRTLAKGENLQSKSLMDRMVESQFFGEDIDSSLRGPEALNAVMQAVEALPLEDQKKMFIAVAKGSSKYVLEISRTYAEGRTAKDGKPISTFVQVDQMLLKRAERLIETMDERKSWEELAEMYMDIGDMLAQVYGGAGYETETAVNQFLRDAVTLSVAWLDSARQQIKDAKSKDMSNLADKAMLNLDADQLERIAYKIEKMWNITLPERQDWLAGVVVMFPDFVARRIYIRKVEDHNNQFRVFVMPENVLASTIEENQSKIDKTFKEFSFDKNSLGFTVLSRELTDFQSAVESLFENSQDQIDGVLAQDDAIVQLRLSFAEGRWVAVQMIKDKTDDNIYYLLVESTQTFKYSVNDSRLERINSSSTKWTGIVKDVDLAALTTAAPGGIDLNGSKLEIDIQGNGDAFEMKIDPAMLEKFQSIDFKGFNPVILDIKPITATPLYAELTGQAPKKAVDVDHFEMTLSYLKED